MKCAGASGCNLQQAAGLGFRVEGSCMAAAAPQCVLPQWQLTASTCHACRSQESTSSSAAHSIIRLLCSQHPEHGRAVHSSCIGRKQALIPKSVTTSVHPEVCHRVSLHRHSSDRASALTPPRPSRVLKPTPSTAMAALAQAHRVLSKLSRRYPSRRTPLFSAIRQQAHLLIQRTSWLSLNLDFQPDLEHDSDLGFKFKPHL